MFARNKSAAPAPKQRRTSQAATPTKRPDAAKAPAEGAASPEDSAYWRASRPVLAALAAAAVLILGAQALAELSLAQQQQSAASALLANHQPAAAEAVARYTLLYATARNDIERSKARDSLHNAVRTLKSQHSTLLAGVGGKAPPREVSDVFEAPPHRLHWQVQELLNHVGRVEQLPVGTLEAHHPALAKVQELAGAPLVDALAKLALLHREDAEAGATRAVTAQRLVILLALAGLGAAVWLIFGPLRRRAADANERVETARKSSVQAEGRARLLMEGSRDGVVLCTPDGSIREMSAAAARIFRVARTDAVGRPMQSIIPDFDFVISAEPRTYPGRRADGRRIDVDITLRAVEEKGTKLLLAFVRDITPVAATSAPTASPPPLRVAAH